MVEKSKKWAILVGLLLIGVIISAGCIGDEPTEEGEASQPSTAETSTDTPSGGLLSDLLDKAKGSPSATYDLVISGGATAGTETMKVWSTETKERTDFTIGGMKSITIIDKEAQVMYMYDPDQNTAIRMDFSSADTSRQAQSFTEAMEEYNPTVVGTEMIDGKKCTVIEFETVTEDATVTQKMWIWKDYGFPIKVEMTSSLTPETTVMEMKNIEFGPIDPSVFELPDDVVITDLGDLESMMESMLPGGA